MAFQQAGRTTKFAVGIGNCSDNLLGNSLNFALIDIPRVEIYSAVNITRGYRSITEIVGHEGETEAVVMAGEHTIDIAITGYLDAPDSVNAEPPKNGDKVTVAGYDLAWIDGVTIAQTPEGVTTINCTVHIRKPTE